MANVGRQITPKIAGFQLNVILYHQLNQCISQNEMIKSKKPLQFDEFGIAGSAQS